MRVIKLPSWKVWKQRSSGIIKVEGSASAFKGSWLAKVRECGVEANIDNQS
jgi:hypothetical protein